MPSIYTISQLYYKAKNLGSTNKKVDQRDNYHSDKQTTKPYGHNYQGRKLWTQHKIHATLEQFGSIYLWSKFADDGKLKIERSTCFIFFKIAWTFAGLEVGFCVSVVPVLEGKAGINGEETGVSDASASKLLELVNSCQNEGYISTKGKTNKDDLTYRMGSW